MGLGKEIRRQRTLRGWTLEKLSERSGVDIGTISALEKRDSTKSKYARALASAFGLSVDELESGESGDYAAGADDPAAQHPRVQEDMPPAYGDVNLPERDLLATYRALNTTFKSLLLADAHKYLLAQTEQRGRKAG